MGDEVHDGLYGGIVEVQRRRRDLVADSQAGEGGLDGPGGAQQVAGGRLGGAHGRPGGGVAQEASHRAELDLVTQRGRGAMGVDVVHLRGIDTRVPHGRAHGPEAAVAILGGCGDMIGVAGHAVPGDLGVDLRPTGARVLVFLENEDAGALPHDKPVAVLVVRPTGLFRGVIEAGGHGPAVDEARDADRADRSLGAPGHHDVGVAIADHPGGVADGVGPCGAGRDDRMIRPLEAMADRHLSRGEVDQGRRDEEGADPAGALLVHFDGGFRDRRQPAYARPDDDAGALKIVGCLRLPAGIDHGLVGGGGGVEDEVINPTAVLCRQGGLRIEGAFDVRTTAAAAVHPRHLACDLAGVTLGVEGRNPPGARLPGQQGLPGDFPTLPQGREKADSGNHDTTHGALRKRKPPRLCEGTRRSDPRRPGGVSRPGVLR